MRDIERRVVSEVERCVASDVERCVASEGRRVASEGRRVAGVWYIRRGCLLGAFDGLLNVSNVDDQKFVYLYVSHFIRN